MLHGATNARTIPTCVSFCSLAPPADIEWKLVYVGSAENESYDQELDTCMVGPVPMGVNSFEFEVCSEGKAIRRRQPPLSSALRFPSVRADIFLCL